MTGRLTYKDAGVDIDAQDRALNLAKEAIRTSFTPGVLGDVGLFGGLFDPAKVGFQDAILVASADGVGTKLEVARMARVYDTVGRDLVNHCIGDILVQGARPLFFMDYAAMGILDPEIVSALVSGCAHACRDSGLALLGGETAEMPGLYKRGDFELAGFIVGAVRREHLLDGTGVVPGQVLLGLRSSGLHTNGYSLARRILFEELGLDLDARPDLLEGATVGEALLAVHRSYLEPLWPLVEARKLVAMAHITGGGLPGNLNRVLGGCDAVIDVNAWQPPGLFRLLVEGGNLERKEAYRAFNMGIGMVLVVDEEEADFVHGRAHPGRRRTWSRSAARWPARRAFASRDEPGRVLGLRAPPGARAAAGPRRRACGQARRRTNWRSWRRADGRRRGLEPRSGGASTACAPLRRNPGPRRPRWTLARLAAERDGEPQALLLQAMLEVLASRPAGELVTRLARYPAEAFPGRASWLRAEVLPPGPDRVKAVLFALAGTPELARDELLLAWNAAVDEARRPAARRGGAADPGGPARSLQDRLERHRPVPHPDPPGRRGGRGRGPGGRHRRRGGRWTLQRRALGTAGASPPSESVTNGAPGTISDEPWHGVRRTPLWCWEDSIWSRDAWRRHAGGSGPLYSRSDRLPGPCGAGA